MDITTIGYYIVIIPATAIALAAMACVVWALYGLRKCTIATYKNKYYIVVAACLFVWWLLIGIAFIVIGDLMN